MKKMLAVLTVILAIFIFPMKSHADVFTTAVLGTSLGLLAGATAMALTHDPGDHHDYPATGAAIGLACGLALGLSGMGSSQFTLNYYQNRSYRQDIFGLMFSLPLH